MTSDDRDALVALFEVIDSAPADLDSKSVDAVETLTEQDTRYLIVPQGTVWPDTIREMLDQVPIVIASAATISTHSWRRPARHTARRSGSSYRALAETYHRFDEEYDALVTPAE